ncbi:agglutinin biogenesis protein MshI [Actimicrobium sp. CCI2.3]|uniref:agglutinin biogenesis protein MshI n=1 Tax=Actimicrobium sp. CCI2.3 TaxID=3048616 RepID=UPI002AB3494C|nr:agglutinin biogenesis protein MshI [Actimicrobium sp. CCI2.3]MDY7572937.1 agglutinin biogenesis protein MshI [Actimicrobium sp. CCI2.3]MEB0020782.1 agglutinin biogenesis protein MshI [Actimicrobium sp. CCI2.3]
MADPDTTRASLYLSNNNSPCESFTMKMFGFPRKKSPGWFAISCQLDGVVVVHMTRAAEGLPVVRAIRFIEIGMTTLASVLGQVARQCQLQGARWTHLLAIGEYQMLTVDLPNVPAEERKLAVRWVVKDMLEQAVADTTLDALAIPVDPNGAGHNATMFVIAASNRFIEHRQGLFDKADIGLAAIDVPELAQRNISALLEPEGQALALLSFGADGGLVTITFRKELYLSRRMDITLLQLQQDDPEQLLAAHERIALDLQRSLDHFYRQHHAIRLSGLVLCLAGAHATRLQSHLQSSLSTSVGTLSLESIVDLSLTPELSMPDMQQRYLMVLGAALRQDEKSA